MSHHFNLEAYKFTGNTFAWLLMQCYYIMSARWMFWALFYCLIININCSMHPLMNLKKDCESKAYEYTVSLERTYRAFLHYFKI